MRGIKHLVKRFFTDLGVGCIVGLILKEWVLVSIIITTWSPTYVHNRPQQRKLQNPWNLQTPPQKPRKLRNFQSFKIIIYLKVSTLCCFRCFSWSDKIVFFVTPVDSGHISDHHHKVFHIAKLQPLPGIMADSYHTTFKINIFIYPPSCQHL